MVATPQRTPVKEPGGCQCQSLNGGNPAAYAGKGAGAGGGCKQVDVIDGEPGQIQLMINFRNQAGRKRAVAGKGRLGNDGLIGNNGYTGQGGGCVEGEDVHL